MMEAKTTTHHALSGKMKMFKSIFYTEYDNLSVFIVKYKSVYLKLVRNIFF